MVVVAVESERSHAFEFNRGRSGDAGEIAFGEGQPAWPRPWLWGDAGRFDDEAERDGVSTSNGFQPRINRLPGQRGDPNR
jgi:hypothetical protein